MDLVEINHRLRSARTYVDFFGVDADEAKVRHTYRDLAKAAHPDAHPDEVEFATDVFRQIQAFYTNALTAFESDSYGVLPTVVMKSKKATHRVFVEGDPTLEKLYRCETDDQYDNLARIPFSPTDNDLMTAEMKSLKKINAEVDPHYAAWFPVIRDSFTYRNSENVDRRINILEGRDPGWVSLREARVRREAMGKPIHALDMCWMWRRVLLGLAAAHKLEIIHGGLTPDNILIHGPFHGVILDNWCYSVPADGTLITAIPNSARAFYPAEVLNKEKPGFGTDIFCIVRSFVYMMDGVDRLPKRMRGFFQACTLPTLRSRPSDALELLSYFDELLDGLGDPYYPRRYREFEI